MRGRAVLVTRMYSSMTDCVRCLIWRPSADSGRERQHRREGVHGAGGGVV